MSTENFSKTPATKTMIQAIRSELKHENPSLKIEMEARLDKVNARFDEIKSDMYDIKSVIEHLAVVVDKALARQKEKESKKDYLLKAYQTLNKRLYRIEDKHDKEISELKNLLEKPNA